MRKVWNASATFDSSGHWVWGKEHALRQRHGKIFHLSVTDSSTTGVKRLLRGSAALERVMSLSDVRVEKVARIRMEIANGCYHVSSADLAQKLIGSMLGGCR